MRDKRSSVTSSVRGGGDDIVLSSLSPVKKRSSSSFLQRTSSLRNQQQQQMTPVSSVSFPDNSNHHRRTTQLLSSPVSLLLDPSVLSNVSFDSTTGNPQQHDETTTVDGSLRFPPLTVQQGPHHTTTTPDPSLLLTDLGTSSLSLTSLSPYTVLDDHRRSGKPAERYNYRMLARNKYMNRKLAIEDVALMREAMVAKTNTAPLAIGSRRMKEVKKKAVSSSLATSEGHQQGGTSSSSSSSPQTSSPSHHNAGSYSNNQGSITTTTPTTVSVFDATTSPARGGGGAGSPSLMSLGLMPPSSTSSMMNNSSRLSNAVRSRIPSFMQRRSSSSGADSFAETVLSVTASRTASVHHHSGKRGTSPTENNNGAIRTSPPNHAKALLSSPYFHAVRTKEVHTMAKDLDQSASHVESTIAEKRQKEITYVSLKAAARRVTELPKPVWKRKYQRTLTNPDYKVYLHKMLVWSIGQSILEVRKAKESIIEAARERVEEVRTAKADAQRKQQDKKRAQIAVMMFSEVFARLKGARPHFTVLTEDRYFSIRTQFVELCAGDTRLSISVKELLYLHELGRTKVDMALVKKLDRDHSGNIMFDEVLHILFPALQMKDIHHVMKKMEAKIIEDEEASKETMDKSLLSDESMRQIREMFRRCDRARKGVVTRWDMGPFTESTNPQALMSAQWFDSHFPTNTSYLTFDEFVDMVKFSFPPFCQSNVQLEKPKGPIHYETLPKELLEVQDMATASV